MSNNNKTNFLLSVLKTPLVIVVLILFGWIAFSKFNLGEKWQELFKKQPLLIDNTPLVITEVRNIAELQTAQLYAEVVVDSIVLSPENIAATALRSIGFPPVPRKEEKKIVLIVKGKVIAGINLKALANDSIFVKDDSVSIHLPPAIILDVITNPTDFETFIENGNWSDTEVQAVKNKSRKILLQKAAQQQLLKKAGAQSGAAIEQLMRSYGFRRVHIQNT